MKRMLPFVLVSMMLLLAGTAFGGEDSPLGEETFADKTVFIHLTENFKENDGPVCVGFNAAWQALRDGARVVIFFDQDATYGIKYWAPGKTDLGLYPLPDRIKDLLVESFGVTRETLPADYQEFLSMLHEQGARILVNGFWNALTEVEKTIKGRENILPYAEPLTLREVLTERKQSDVYLRF